LYFFKKIPMMKNQMLVWAMVGGLLAACDESAPSPELPCTQTVEVPVGQRLALNELEWVEVTNLQDSRCPANALCLWPGEATLQLRFSHRGSERATSMCLGMCGGGAGRPTKIKSADTVVMVAGTENYRFILSNLLPYPGSGEAGPTRAVVRVERCAPTDNNK
jgi:hypothetical protein